MNEEFGLLVEQMIVHFDLGVGAKIVRQQHYGNVDVAQLIDLLLDWLFFVVGDNNGFRTKKRL